MKFVVFFLVLFLSACASQNNTSTMQQSQAKPKPTTYTKNTQTNNAKQTETITEKKTVPEQPSTSTTKLPSQKPAVTNKPKPPSNNFTCTYDSIYKVYAASSVETDGGKFIVTVNKDKLTVKSLSPEIPGTYHLDIRTNNQFKIFASTKSKQFIYSRTGGNFMFNTGIGPSGFNISKGGHTGRQMRASGKCVPN